MKRLVVVALLVLAAVACGTAGGVKPVEVICAGCKLAEATICAIQKAIEEAKPCTPPKQKMVVNMDRLFSEHPEMPQVECR